MNIKYNLEKINNFCNQKADYEVFIKEFEEINSNILIIKSNLNLSGSYSKNEETLDIINIPNQLLSALMNFRIDLFNQIYDLTKGLNENMKDDIEIIENVYILCTKIKLIFIKAILKSILLENQDNLDDFFHLHHFYNFKDFYNLFSDQDFFKEFLIENFLSSKFNNFQMEEIQNSVLDNLKINSFVLFKMNLCVEFFSNKMEKLRYNLDMYFSNEKLGLNDENLLLKDFYSINNSLEQMTIKIILLIIGVFKNINGILFNDENSNSNLIDNSDADEGKVILFFSLHLF